MEWLLGLIGTLEGDIATRRRLRVVSNPMLLDAAGRLSLPETARAEVTPGQDVSVRATQVARRAVEIARKPIAYEQLVQALTGPGADRQDVEAMIDVLWRNEILLTDLRAAPTSGDPARRLRERLAETGAAPSVVESLDELQADLGTWDQLPAADRLAELPALTTRMARLHPTRPSACPIQVDTALTLTGRGIHRSVAAEAARAAEVLLRIGPYPDGLPHIRAYREAFMRRYGPERAVPLLEVLDPVIGLGAPSLGAEVLMDADEAIRAGRRDRALHVLAANASREGRRIVELDEAAIAQLQTWTPSLERTPVSMELVVLVAARSAAGVDAGEFHLVVGPNLGATTAGRHMTRFADLLGEETLRALGDIAAGEAARDPGRLRAELVYLPAQARAANVIVHPSTRGAELVLNAGAGTPDDGVVPLDELVVSLEGSYLRIDWPARDTTIVAVPGHMLNVLNAPAVARFLLDVEADRHPALSPFDWGSLAGSPFLPRVQSGRVVLAPAQWQLPAETMPEDARAFADALAGWRCDWNVPRHVYLAVADNRLLLDLDTDVAVSILREEARRDATGSHGLVLHEALPGVEDAWLEGPDGGHLVELVVPLMRRRGPTSTNGGRPRRAVRSPATAERRLRPPGSDWLYLKLLCAPAAQDDLLAGPVRGLTEFAVKAGLADRWFFIRYADPEPHLRIRFHGQPVVLLGALIDEVCAWATELVGDGVCQRFSIETYEREVERYGGARGMDAAEEVFAADSVAVCELLDAVRRSPSALRRADVAMLGVDRLLGACGIEGAPRVDWLRRHAPLSRDDGTDYRARKDQLRVLIEADADEWHPLVAILERRFRAMAPAAARLEALEVDASLDRAREALVADFAHLHCNRMLGASPDEEQRLLALLRRTREALAARAAAITPGAHG